MDTKNTILNRVVIPILIFIALFMFLNKTLAIAWVVLVLAFNMWKGRSSIYMALGNSAQSKGAFTLAGQYYQKAINASPFDTRPALTYGYMLLRMGQTAEAEKLFDFIISSRFPSAAQNLAKANLAIVYWKTDRISQGIDILLDLHEAGYRTTVTYGTLPYLLMIAGRTEDALIHANEAYQYNSSDAVIVENLARINHLSGNMDQASSLYAVLEKLSPSYPEGWYNIGLFYKDTGNIEKARQSFERSLKCIFTFLSAVTKSEVEAQLKSVADN